MSLNPSVPDRRMSSSQSRPHHGKASSSTLETLQGMKLQLVLCPKATSQATSPSAAQTQPERRFDLTIRPKSTLNSVPEERTTSTSAKDHVTEEPTPIPNIEITPPAAQLSNPEPQPTSTADEVPLRSLSHHVVHILSMLHDIDEEAPEFNAEELRELEVQLARGEMMLVSNSVSVSDEEMVEGGKG